MSEKVKIDTGVEFKVCTVGGIFNAILEKAEKEGVHYMTVMDRVIRNAYENGDFE
jgi:hypothetical protein|tara:strand:- start:307 stop:471 length:165 start_codon:yes stop_codon:yes gene_type:complete